MIQRAPQTDDELYELVKVLWGHAIPRHSVCPEHSSPFDAFADAFFARSPVAVWKASRGFGGKSRTLAFLVLTEAVLLGADVNLLGGSGAQSQNIHEAMKDGWMSDFAPHHMITNETQYGTRLSNGAKIKALLASQRSVRGPHPQRLRLDEIDEMDVSILDSAFGQPMPGKGVESHIVLSSTHQYPDKTMSEMLLRAGSRGWPVFEWCIASGEKVATARGDVAIEFLRPDDLVLTRMGFKPLQHLTVMGVKEVVRVSLADGRSVVCTPDHLLHTPAGWVPADAALAVTTVGSDVPVGVPARGAGGVALAERPRAASVLSRLHSLQMLQSDAGSVPAKVIDMTLRGSVDAFPDVPMGLLGAPSTIWESDLLQAVPVALGPRVGEAGLHTSSSRVVSIETIGRMPVYDIGVKDAHEFFVNGVLVHNCWRETSNPIDGWLTQSAIERKKAEVTKHMWEVEYDLQEPSMGNRAFDTEAVEKMFSLGDQVYKSDPYGTRGEQLVFEEPRRDADYVTGADWAQTKDYTVIATFKTSVEPWELVAYSRTHRKPYPVMIRLMNDRLKDYGGTAIHDATGLGAVVNDYLDSRVKPFIMSGRQRADMLSEYISAVEGGKLRAPKVESAYAEHKYVSVEDMYNSGQQYHLPDTVCAFALCWHMRRRRPAVRPMISDELVSTSSKWAGL